MLGASGNGNKEKAYQTRRNALFDGDLRCDAFQKA
jgi:hypothetical protein